MGARRSGSPSEHVEPRADPFPPLWLTVPARPGQLAGLRRAMREWMAQAGLSEHDATSALVAVGEAASNAVEHAYLGTEPGLMRLTARLDTDGVLSVQVIDDGCWRPPSDHMADRGRGFPLMRAMMDQVDVHQGQNGTAVRMRLALDRRTL